VGHGHGDSGVSLPGLSWQSINRAKKIGIARKMDASRTRLREFCKSFMRKSGKPDLRVKPAHDEII
jgi:hypothetical protein